MAPEARLPRHLGAEWMPPDPKESCVEVDPRVGTRGRKPSSVPQQELVLGDSIAGASMAEESCQLASCV